MFLVGGPTKGSREQKGRDIESPLRGMMLSRGSMVFSLENEKSFADEKKRKSWQAEQVQCHRTEVGKLGAMGHIWSLSVWS